EQAGLAGRENKWKEKSRGRRSEKKEERTKNKRRRMLGASHTASHGVRVRVRYTEIYFLSWRIQKLGTIIVESTVTEY
ncbi:hypothetical protein STEG23_027314, partial [Scotinomys teguina]